MARLPLERCLLSITLGTFLTRNHSRMSLTQHQHARTQIIVVARRRSLAKLRKAYFSGSREAAIRYRIPFDRLLKHLWIARKTNPRFTLRHVKSLDDLIHAVACIDGFGLAWVDLAERYERPLVRQCLGSHDEIAAVMMVRRLFIEMRADDHGTILAMTQTMGGYTGARPLSAWLADRLNVIRTKEALIRVQQRPATMRAAMIKHAQSHADRGMTLLGQHALPISFGVNAAATSHDPATAQSHLPAEKNMASAAAVATADG